jgi:hypothetical protein
VSHHPQISCEAFKDMAAGYALRVLDEPDRIACANHLAGMGPHHGCEAALETARWVTAQLAAAVPASPPRPSLWRAIANRITGVPHENVDRRHRLRPHWHVMRARSNSHAPG